MKNLFCFIFCIASFTLLAQEQWTIESTKTFQDILNKEYATPGESPLTDEDLAAFKGLDFYPISPKFVVKATFTKSENEQSFKMKTTGTRTPEYIKYGELYFKLDNKEYKLNVYQGLDLMKKPGFEDYLFLPFSDLTCGKQSYIGGRYIDMRIPKGKTVIIDFNQAYNPYCAYNHKYSCPIVPLENDLEIEILAGVKKFHD
ncbi:MAG: DUF1684 domain-containing protein [Flavobacterium sp.]|uniref:DUF1684 domain-containing protein n=1 Tax=Flavobacterium sp. TaxID=239 RepID=UPI0032677C16